MLAGVGLDVLSDSSASRIIGSRALPGGVAVAFILTATVVVGISIWYLVRRGRGGVIPDGRHNIYMALLAAIFVSGVVEDILKAAVGVLLGAHPWWSLVPIYMLGYVIFWAVALFFLKRRHGVQQPG